MAYGELYRLQYEDYFANVCRLEIWQDGYTGSYSEIKGSGKPVNIRYLAEGDDFFKGIKPSSCEMNLMSETDMQFLGLFTGTARNYRVIFKKGATEGTLAVKWRGYIDPDDYREPYLHHPYVSTIKAHCGLSALKGTYLDKPDTTGSSTFKEKSFIEIIAECLEKTGHSLSIYASIDLSIYDDGVRTVQGRILEDIYDDWRKYFNDDDGESSIDCYTILEDILKTFEARIYQRSGGWWIERIPDNKDATLDYDTYDSAGSYDGALNGWDNAVELTGRDGSPLCVWAHHRGMLEVAPAMKEYTIKWKPQKLENILKSTNLGGEFIADEFNAGPLFKYWTYLEVDPYNAYSWEKPAGDYIIFNGYTYPNAAIPIIHAYFESDPVWFEPFRMQYRSWQSPVFKVSARAKLILRYGSYNPYNCFFGWRLRARCNDAAIVNGQIANSPGNTLHLFSQESEWGTSSDDYCGSSWTFHSYGTYQDFENTIAQPLNVAADYTGSVGITMQIFPVQLLVDNSASSNFRLEINSVQVEVVNEDVDEELVVTQVNNEDNRYIPDDVERKFSFPMPHSNGDHFSRYMMFDSEGEELEHGDILYDGSSYVMSGAYTPIMNQFKSPHIKLMGTLLSDDLDFGMTIEDGSARRYMCIGVTWDTKACQWSGLWQQVYDKDNTLAGDYDPDDFSSDDFWTYEE